MALSEDEGDGSLVLSHFSFLLLLPLPFWSSYRPFQCVVHWHWQGCRDAQEELSGPILYMVCYHFRRTLVPWCGNPNSWLTCFVCRRSSSNVSSEQATCSQVLRDGVSSAIVTWVRPTTPLAPFPLADHPSNSSHSPKSTSQVSWGYCPFIRPRFRPAWQIE
jgi:hypothetical protein